MIAYASVFTLPKLIKNLSFSIALDAFHQFSLTANSFGYFSPNANQVHVISHTPPGFLVSMR